MPHRPTAAHLGLDGLATLGVGALPLAPQFGDTCGGLVVDLGGRRASGSGSTTCSDFLPLDSASAILMRSGMCDMWLTRMPPISCPAHLTLASR
jgi:hypothetical protein